jgi:uncharacterized membrane protein YfcA
LEASLAALGSPGHIAIVFAIVFVAAVVQVGLGMGFGLTAAPLIALLNPELVPASILILGLLTATWGSWRERDGIVWNEVGIGILGRGAGVIAGTIIIASLSDRKTFMLVFGVTIAIAVALSLSGWRIAFSRWSIAGMSALSGVMGTITSVGAPPMALVYQHQPASTARPTMATFFAFGCAFSLTGLYFAGWLGTREVLLAATMFPALIAGIFTARILSGRFDARYRPALLAISGVAAAILVVRGLT